VIILAIIDFAFRFQRPQQLAVEYARRGHRVFWISANRFLPLTSSTPFTLRKLRDNLWEADLRAEPVDIYQHELSPALQHSLQSSFHEFARECSILDNIILVQLPFWRRSALDLKELTGGVLAYDCMDEWHSFNNLGRFNRMEEQSLVHDADVLFVTARRLADKFESVGLKPVLVRNGVDYEFFTRSTPSAAQWRSDGPIIGYFGAIADWIDLDLIYNVAKLRPSYTFVLIGQVFNRDTSALQTLPNIYLLGHQPYDSIPGFLHLFDVCHIPFLLNAITAATDPVKLYEYLALGKPVVATDMAELRDYSDLVYIGRGAEDYAAKLDLALLENTPASRHRRATFAKANTWSHRVDTMAETISAALPTVTIVIVTYNSAGFIEPCLASIWRNDSYPAIEVIVVDNASQDDTDDVLQNHRRNQPRLRYERLTTNRGFAAANNIGAAMGTGEYLLFLNADTITTPGWIGRLLQHLRAEPTIGLICPVTNFAGNEAKISITYRDLQEMEQFAVELASQKRGTWTELPMVPLYCAMMRRSIYEQIGGIDEQYEIGMFEDDDLSAAVRSLTLATAVAEDCFVHHFGQGSFSKLAPEEYNRIFTANRLRFERKWSTKWTGHKLRTGVRPPFEEIRFDPKEFCELSGATHTPAD
jgi:GT2 family glycosyltransferase/glycosyltransferase involved in cell wall biosynthesis